MKTIEISFDEFRALASMAAAAEVIVKEDFCTVDQKAKLQAGLEMYNLILNKF